MVPKGKGRLAVYQCETDEFFRLDERCKKRLSGPEHICLWWVRHLGTNHQDPFFSPPQEVLADVTLEKKRVFCSFVIEKNAKSIEVTTGWSSCACF